MWNSVWSVYLHSPSFSGFWSCVSVSVITRINPVEAIFFKRGNPTELFPAADRERGVLVPGAMGRPGAEQNGLVTRILGASEGMAARSPAFAGSKTSRLIAGRGIGEHLAWGPGFITVTHRNEGPSRADGEIIFLNLPSQWDDWCIPASLRIRSRTVPTCVDFVFNYKLERVDWGSILNSFTLFLFCGTCSAWSYCTWIIVLQDLNGDLSESVEASIRRGGLVQE